MSALGVRVRVGVGARDKVGVGDIGVKGPRACHDFVFSTLTLTLTLQLCFRDKDRVGVRVGDALSYRTAIYPDCDPHP